VSDLIVLGMNGICFYFNEVGLIAGILGLLGTAFLFRVFYLARKQ